MEILIGIVVGVLLTGVGAFFMLRRERQLMREAEERGEQRVQQLTSSLNSLQSERDKLLSDKELYISEKATLQAEVKAGEMALQVAQEQAQKDEEKRKEDLKTELQLARDAMRAQFEKEMAERTETLKHTNAEQMRQVVEPLQQELKRLQDVVDKTKESSDKNTASLAQSIQYVLEHDKERDKTTQTLANALKNRGKVQGDWGEQVLANILLDSGLREGEEFFVQDNVKDEEGRNLRPDVVVKGADGSRIIIDSKVSLSAYSDYVGAETDEDRKAADKANYDSIWRHVEELSAKNYSRLVEHAVPIVLMFVPNEGSYILAMNHDSQLGSRAYKKGVLIINPTNLVVVLRLIFMTWQNTRQEKNCEEIMRLAAGIYEKYTTFADSYVTLGNQLKTLTNTYDKGAGQLRDGNGNLSGRIEKLLHYGVSSNKSIPETLQSVLPVE